MQGKHLAVYALRGLRCDAGSINSYKFIIGVLELALKMDLNLQPNTPAKGVSVIHPDQTGAYITSRLPRASTQRPAFYPSASRNIP